MAGWRVGRGVGIDISIDRATSSSRNTRLHERDAPMRAIIAIPTYKRPESLKRTLESIVTHSLAPSVEVLIIDNDPKESAATIASLDSPLTISYIVEPRPGVAHVRNRALAERPDLDAVIFVDDDQAVHPHWLTAFRALHRKYPNDILTGPVAYEFATCSPPGPVSRMVFARDEHCDGARVSTTGTGNCLIPLASLESLNEEYFDDSFGRSGGEDTEFFSRYTRAGGTIRWCAEARVTEFVPLERCSEEAALARVTRNGYINGSVARKQGVSTWSVLLGGLARVVSGAIWFAVLRISGKPVAPSLVRLHSGHGRTRSAVGAKFFHYGESST